MFLLRLEFDESVKIDESLKDLISRLLEKNPEKRIKMSEIKVKLTLFRHILGSLIKERIY